MSTQRVTIITYTQFGPFYSGSTLVVNPSYAQQLINAYGSGLRVVSNFPGTYWYQNGAILRIYPASVSPTPPVGNVNVVFLNSVYDPARGTTFNANTSYNFSLSGLRSLASRVGGLTFYTDRFRSQTVDTDDLDEYTGGVIYADQAVYTFRAPIGVTPLNDVNANASSFR